MSQKCIVCGKKFITQQHVDAHADEWHPGWRTPRAKGWRTPYGFVDFREPVTYEQACRFMKTQMEELEAMKAGRD